MFYFSKVLGEAKLKTRFCTVIALFGFKFMRISRGTKYPGPVSSFGEHPQINIHRESRSAGSRGSQRTSSAWRDQKSKAKQSTFETPSTAALTVERQNEHLGGKRKRKTISGAY
jgi:hypothetical protein